MAFPVTLGFSNPNVAAGEGTTLTWKADANGATCTAGGSWGGTQQPSGSVALRPTAEGNYYYSLTCTATLGGNGFGSAYLLVSPAGEAQATHTDMTDLMGLLSLVTCFLSAWLGFTAGSLR